MQLSILQSFVKKSPDSYREEFVGQYTYLKNELEILTLCPSKESPRLVELMDFVSQTISCYEDFAEEFLSMLVSILETKTESLQPTIRFKVYQSLAISHRQLNGDSLKILKLSFHLLSVHDKLFRAYVTEFILTEIKRLQSQKQQANSRNAIQSFIHSIVGDTNSTIAYRCVEILSRLYRKKIWTDARSVNILALACFHPEQKVYLGAINFFLGIESALAADEEDEENEVGKTEINKFEHNKKTKKRARLIEKQKSQLTKKMNAKLSEKQAAAPLYPAIMLIHDPHSLAEHLFKKLKQNGGRFEHKLIIMNFLSQLIGCHKLLLLNFYSFVQKYLTSHNTNVTNILAYLAQACHDVVPPSEISPVLKTIANNFVSDRSTEESITVGINVIREVISRVPAVLLEDDMDGFVQDLAQYGHKNKKYVVAAARSLVNLVREHHPSLLKKADRGRFSDKQKRPDQYGAEKITSYEDLGSSESDSVGASDNGSDDGEGDWEEVDGSEDDEENDCDEEDEWEEVDGEDEEEGQDEEDDEEDGSDADESDVDEVARPKKKVRLQVESETADDESGQSNPESEDEEDEDNDSDEDNESDEDGPEYRVDPTYLLPQGRMHKATKIERLQQILSGRVDKRFNHEGHAGGLTNKEKERKKNYVMVRRGKRSVAMKKRTSVQERRWRKQGKVRPSALSISTLNFRDLPIFLCRRSNTVATSEREDACKLSPQRLCSLANRSFWAKRIFSDKFSYPRFDNVSIDVSKLSTSPLLMQPKSIFPYLVACDFKPSMKARFTSESTGLYKMVTSF